MTLDVRDVSLSRGGRRLLAGVGFCVAEGRALMLRGPNGVGKTSLLRALAGLGRIEGGSVHFANRALTDRDAWAETVAYAAHADAIKAQLSVAENLEFWARIYGTAPDAAMDRFDLASISDRLAGACSAGQRRRLGLARLVLSQRPLWLLDEPTVSLDTAATLALSEAVAAHLASGGVAVIASHETDVVQGAETLTLAPAATPSSSSSAENDPFLDGAAL